MEKQPVDDIVSKLRLLDGPVDHTPQQLDELLTVLRKHGVNDFKQDQFGLHIKLEAAPIWGPSPANELIRLQLEMAALAKPPKDEPEQEPIPEPEARAVEPIRHDMADVLFGAK